MPKISICIPFHWMSNWEFFITRCLESIEKQTFKDYEIVMAKVGSMPVTSNRVMQSAQGQLIKVLYLDDYFAHPNALQEIADNFEFMDEWMITGCDTNPHPYWTDDIETGNNKLGSPSCLTLRNTEPELFDERMSWLLDVDLYKRLYEKHGEPKILDTINVNIGTGPHQMTHILTEEEKLSEHNLIKKKYE